MGLAGTTFLGKLQEVEHHWRVGPLDREGVPQAWEDYSVWCPPDDKESLVFF